MTYTLHLGDCLDVLRAMPDNSVDAIVCDPPYGLAFMGKKWDYDVPSIEIWRECLRVLKPGGHLLAFAGTRTQHRMAVRIEDAGFEIRDMIAWVYGCLSEDTEILVDGKWEPYHNAVAGRLALCYDADRDEYQWQPIQELVEYDYEDTAFRIHGDHTDQIVSRNHRCLVERGGSYTFALAETLERQARVPVLESVQDLLDAFPVPHQGASDPQSVLRLLMCAAPEEGSQAVSGATRAGSCMCSVRDRGLEAGSVAQENGKGVLQPIMPRQGRDGSCPNCPQVQSHRDEVSRDRVVWSGEPCMEGRVDVLPQARELQASQVRSVSRGSAADGPQGRVRHGASDDRCACPREVPVAHRSGSPPEPRPARQPAGELGAVFQQPGSQAVRGEGYTRSDLVRVEPFHYTGRVWCVRVPSGAFVARRRGLVFVTGNSGFPKSLDVSKAIDKAAGAVREVVGAGAAQCEYIARGEPCPGHGDANGRYGETVHTAATAPATPAAAQWSGWGTALKPSLETVTVARKPLSGTVAANVLQWGTGALNVGGCRVGTAVETWPTSRSYAPGQKQPGGTGATQSTGEPPPGRWPANLIHDGSAEVVGLFPQSNGQHGAVGPQYGAKASVNAYGDYGPRGDFQPRGDSGSAARFFYCPKASKLDRDHGCDALPERTAAECVDRTDDSAGMDSPRAGAGRTTGARNHHPTVKPTDLMRYLCRLVTPPGGTVLDPFVGSGSTGRGAVLEGFAFIGIDRDPEYLAIAEARIAAAVQLRVEELDEAAREAAKPQQLSLF